MTHSSYAVRPICNEHWQRLPPELRAAILAARHEGPRKVAETLNEAQKELAG
jgi:TRAP-type C4-dicarboxylate transport system substrate-binding protein